MKTNELKKNTSTSNFNSLLRTFETEYIKDKTSDAFATALQNLATAIAHSVVKTCLDPQRKQNNNEHVCDSGCNPQLEQIKKQIYYDSRLLINTINTCNNCYEYITNKDGDVVNTVDSKLNEQLNKLVGQCLGEGIDLVHTAIVALLDESNKVEKTKYFLETEYTDKKLKKKTYFTADPDIEYQDVECVPIQQTYRAVRKYIYDSASLTIDNNGYTYIEDIVKKYNGSVDTIYIRMKKYADMGGYARDFNNVDTVYTANISDYKTTDGLIKALQLTNREEKILRLRLEGLSIEDIGKKMGVSHVAITGTLKKIQSKVVGCEAFDKIKVNKAVSTKSQNCCKQKLTTDDYKKIRQLRFEGMSCTAIANKYNVSKMHISRICK